MLGLSSLPDQKTSLPQQLETDQAFTGSVIAAVLPQDGGASRRSARFLWTGLGLTVPMLIGVAILLVVGRLSAGALHPLAVHGSAGPSHLVTEIAFNPMVMYTRMPVLGPRGGSSHAQRTALHSTVRPGSRPVSFPVMLAEPLGRQAAGSQVALSSVVGKEVLEDVGVEQPTRLRRQPKRPAKGTSSPVLATPPSPFQPKPGKPNPLKWPSIDAVGKAFYEQLMSTLILRGRGGPAMHGKAERKMALLQGWLDSPCVVTFKLDGTNVGIADDGMIVGRKQVLAPMGSYQKVAMGPVLKGYEDKAARVHAELANLVHVVGGEAISRTMLYGELVVNDKYNYVDAGIFKEWLCFGIAVAPEAKDKEAALRLASALRVAGFNSKATKENTVVIAPNGKLARLLFEFQIRSVFDGYRPPETHIEAPPYSMVMKQQQSTSGILPNSECIRFTSLRELLLSEWARSILLPVDGAPLGEGLVIASEADGTLFKWKHAGESLGSVPKKLAEAVKALRGLSASARAESLPQGTLEIFERLLQVATTRVAKSAGSEPKADADAGAPADEEAIAVWKSALTKIDSLESVFEHGRDVFEELRAVLVEQVAEDLVIDYDADKVDAQSRAKRIVFSQLGKRYNNWQLSF